MTLAEARLAFHRGEHVDELTLRRVVQEDIEIFRALGNVVRGNVKQHPEERDFAAELRGSLR